MQQMPWNTPQIKQCEKETGQAMLVDEHTLVHYSQDFGKLWSVNPNVVCTPDSIEKIQQIVSFANQHNLPITIRGNGLSQGGQSLSNAGSLIMHLKNINQVFEVKEQAIWVEANASWAQLLDETLKSNLIPYVLPYNCNLSVAGVLSAGGVGASSFKFGSVTAHVTALEVVLANGEIKIIDAGTDLFEACLSGQGRFAIITKAKIKLRPCLKQARTFFLMYLDEEQWLKDLEQIQLKADYIESFCSPCIQGAKLNADKRMPFAQWFYAIHFSIEYEQEAPNFSEFSPVLNPWQLLHQQDESIHSYLHRHDSRFEAMKITGQWELYHPWYECFIDHEMLVANLSDILNKLPLHYATVVQIVAIKKQPQTGFLMLPEAKQVYALMILNPGVNPVLLPSCLQAIAELDKQLLAKGGKRYLSGYLGEILSNGYWKNHFGSCYDKWITLKKAYDPQHILQSFLYDS